MFFMQIPYSWYANPTQMGLWECGNCRTFADEFKIRQRAQAAPQQFEYSIAFGLH